MHGGEGGGADQRGDDVTQRLEAGVDALRLLQALAARAAPAHLCAYQCSSPFEINGPGLQGTRIFVLVCVCVQTLKKNVHLTYSRDSEIKYYELVQPNKETKLVLWDPAAHALAARQVDEVELAAQLLA